MIAIETTESFNPEGIRPEKFGIKSYLILGKMCV